MKRTLLLLAGLLFSALTIFAQDIITKKNGEDIKADVLEIDNHNVRYKLFDEPDGVIYTIRKSEIIMIRHESGRNEVFNDLPVAALYGYGQYREPVAGITPGMKYKELKYLYNYENWDPGFGSRYNPALMGFCSFMIPGLGQMICGEVGRGFAWFGGTLGAYALSIIGIGLGANSTYYSYEPAYGGSVSMNYGQALAGSVLMLAGSAAVLVVDICSIVDACRVAKVRNMYEQDLRQLNYSLELHPSVDYIRTPTGAQPTAGFTLAMKF